MKDDITGYFGWGLHALSFPLANWGRQFRVNGIRYNISWIQFWEDRFELESWLRKQQYILMLNNHIKFLENWKSL